MAPRYQEQMGFRSARMTMTLIAYFVRRHRVISDVRRRFTYYDDVTEFGASHKHTPNAVVLSAIMGQVVSS